VKRGKLIKNLYHTFTLTEFRREFKLKTIPLILLGFLVNTACWTLTGLLDWPIWLDTLGTVIASFVGGPLVGMITGLITSILWFWFEPMSIIFSPVHAVIGFIPGYTIMWYWVREKPKLDFLGLPLFISFITVFLSTILRVFFCIDLIVCYTLAGGVAAYFINLFFELGRVFFTHRFAREVVDKTIVVLSAWFFIRAPKIIRQKRWWWGRKRSKY
jgi:energy-coupling factor transport system substrate-specific component